MNKSNLHQRWTEAAIRHVANGLRSGNGPKSLSTLGQYEGRFDLRCFGMPAASAGLSILSRSRGTIVGVRSMPAGNILFFAGPEDDAALRGYAQSIGLTLLHPHAYKMTAEENERAFDNPVQGGYFSFLPVEQLHRHPHPNIGLCEALDPLILYVRPSYRPPNLVAGQIHWYTDVRSMAAQTKLYFQKLRRWVQTTWRRREEDGYYMGPAAERLVAEANAGIAYLPPGVTVTTIPVK
jgi:hypothetical protein